MEAGVPGFAVEACGKTLTPLPKDFESNFKPKNVRS